MENILEPIENSFHDCNEQIEVVNGKVCLVFNDIDYEPICDGSFTSNSMQVKQVRRAMSLGTIAIIPSNVLYCSLDGTTHWSNTSYVRYLNDRDNYDLPF